MILAILQARLSSSRLPKKVLKPILGKPMLLHQIERLQNSKMINKLVVATSDDDSDNDIAQMCIDNNIEVFRGSLNNVLDRFYQCAKFYNPKHIVRLTGDCPLADWQVIDDVIQYHLDSNYDYTNGSVKPAFPDGLDVEVVKREVLEIAWNNATSLSEKEHVTYYINKRKSKFKIGLLHCKEDLSHLRWTVDELEDFIFVEKVYQNLYENNPYFLMRDVLELLDAQPELLKINSHFEAYDGIKKLIEDDKEF
jgi:spore coat polysaccharide biosynthesis protein SpsF (cytidylyltransferase family)